MTHLPKVAVKAHGQNSEAWRTPFAIPSSRGSATVPKGNWPQGGEAP